MTVLPLGRGQTILMWLYYIHFFWTVVPAPGDRHVWSTGGMITRRWKSKWKEKKPAPPPHPPKVCVYYFCDRTWAYVLRRWLLTTWTTLTHSFTNSLTQALPPSWEVNSCSGIKKFPILYKTYDVQYYVHKNLSLVPVLSKMNPLHMLPVYC